MPKKNSLSSVLVTGGAGMVGSRVPFGIKPTRTELDILNISSIRNAFKRYKPSVVFHLAALVDMELCERHPEKAYETNVIGTSNLAKICREKNIRLVFLSSGAVFDGRKKTPYIETDRPNPLNIYGQTKLIGELIVKDIVPNSLIIRTGWLFGGGKRYDKKFVAKCFKKLQEGKTVLATKDRYGSPTFIPDLINAIAKLIQSDKTGIINITNSGIASYFDMARVIQKAGYFKTKVKAVRASDMESLNVRRGKMEGLASKKIKLRPWKDALTEYIRSLNDGNEKGETGSRDEP